MSVDPVLRKMVDEALAVRIRLWKVGAIASGICGAGIATLPFVIPTGPGEWGAPLGFGLFGILMLVAGAGVWRAAGRQAKRILELIFDRPEHIREVEIVVIRQGGAGVLHAVHLIDATKKRYGLIVGSLEAAEQMRARIVR